MGRAEALACPPRLVVQTKGAREGGEIRFKRLLETLAVAQICSKEWSAQVQDICCVDHAWKMGGAHGLGFVILVHSLLGLSNTPTVP
jgi:hypothetical protein